MRETRARVVMAMAARVAMATLGHDGRAMLARVVMVIAALGAMATPARVGMARGDRAGTATDAVSTLRVRGRVEHPNARRGGFVPGGRMARIVRGTTIRASRRMSRAKSSTALRAAS